MFTKCISILATLLCVTNGLHLRGEVTVTPVSATQLPDTKTAQIVYDLANDDDRACYVRCYVTRDAGENWIELTELPGVTGDVGNGITPGTGKTITWDPSADWPPILFPAVTVRVIATDDQIIPAGFVRIPAGSFTMGSPDTELGRDADEVQHQVTLTKDYFMAIKEVTELEWRTVRDWAIANGYDMATGSTRGDALPVTNVNWYDVAKWLNAKSEMEGLIPVYHHSFGVYRTGDHAPVWLPG